MIFFVLTGLSVSLALLILGWYWHYKPIKICASVWLLYTAYEFAIYLRIWCSGDCNIRIDLLVMWPILVIVTIITAIITLVHLIVYYKKKAK